MKNTLKIYKAVYRKITSSLKIIVLSLLAITTAHALTSSDISSNQSQFIPSDTVSAELSTEQDIDSNKSLVVALPPITEINGGFKNKTEAARSFFINFWTYWATLNNYQISFSTLTLNEAKLALKQGKVDIIASGTYDKKDIDKFYTSIPYIELQGVLFQHKDYSLQNKSDKKLTIATHSPLAPTENFIDGDKFETMHFSYMESLLGQLYDFDLIYSFMPHQDQNILVRDLKQYKYNSNITTPLLIRAITTRENRQLMLDINEGIRNINKNSAEATLDVSTLEENGGFKILLGNYLTHLSKKQQAFILDNPVITYGIPEGGYPPYTMTEFGQLYGLNADLLNELRERLGLAFKAKSYSSFERSLHALKRKSISLLPIVYDTPLRREWFLFSDPIDQYSASIISHNNKKFNKLEDLTTASIAVVRGAQMTNIIQKKSPDARLLFMNNESEALDAIVSGKADAYVGNISNAVYLINKLHLENLYLHNSNDFDSQMQYSMAVSKSQPELQTLINLGLHSIDQATLTKYRSKWLKTILIQGHDERYEELYFWLVILIICSLIIFFSYFTFSQYQKKNQLKAKKKIEEALHEAQDSKKEAERSALAKTQFLARMSHEIRTPMNGVLGMAEAISFTDLNAEQKDLLKTLHNSALNLMGLLNDVLDFSKMDAGKMILDLRVFSLSTMLEQVIDNFRHQASSKGISLNYSIDSSLQSFYIGDDMRLMQVFNNLLSNALKFTAKGGITLQVNKADDTQITKDCHSHANFQAITVEIQDTGIGISPDKIDTLFTPFVQAENHTTRRFGGSGLGLSICKEIINAMGGDIKVTSMPKLGSIFSFNFILKNCDQPETEGHNKVNTPQTNIESTTLFNNFEVLLAEDNAINRKVLCGQLTRLGLCVDTAENGLIAYQKFQQKSYDIIFSDCHMPEMDGFSLANKISRERTAHTPQLIAITADALSDASQKCLAAGFDHYLSKPCPIDLLHNKLLEVQETILPLQQKEETNVNLNDKEEDICKAGSLHLDKEYTLMMSGEDFELVNEMIAVYLETTPEDISKIQLASEQLSYREVKDIAHKIKGSIQYFGAQDLAAIAKQIEGFADSKDAENLQQKTHLFTQGLQELHKELQDWQH